MHTHFEWIFFLPQDKRDRNNLFWSLVGVDCVNREIHYHKLHTAIPEDEEAHIAEITQLLHSIDCLSSENTLRPSWATLPHVFSDCINTDSGIWICLLVQALVYRLPSSIITPMTIGEARPYLALGLLEQNLPTFSNMLIRRVGLESTWEKDEIPEPVTTHFPEIYYPGQAELQRYLHSYNMLHEDYSYDSFIDDNISQNDRQLQ